MGIDPQILEILACPVCKTPVREEEDGQILFCEQCKRVFPVRNEIPVMLVEEAKIRES